MILIHNPLIINEGVSFVGSVLIENEQIKEIYTSELPPNILDSCDNVIDADGMYLIPGVIDDQVHFRDPGLTHKGDLFSESCAAVAGGVTSFMDMPNTAPQTITNDLLYEKLELAEQKSVANFSFYLGATNDNIKELIKIDNKKTCGVKLFMGASTGNMLVDNEKSLQAIFAEVDSLIATHCEKEEIIRNNVDIFRKKFGENIPVQYHPQIRSDEACYVSSAQAVELAHKYGSRLHILHLSTAREMSLLSNAPIADKKITAEVCVHHLWFTDEDYQRLGSKIKCNPAVKSEADREALREALKNGKLDIVATDHAPHLETEKNGGCLQAASGIPLVQHSLQLMLQMADEGILTHSFVVDKMCHEPANLFKIKDRGYIRKGYFADLVLINPEKSYKVSNNNILYKCGWSPFEDYIFNNSIEKTFVNGNLVFADGKVNTEKKGKRLSFDR